MLIRRKIYFQLFIIRKLTQSWLKNILTIPKKVPFQIRILHKAHFAPPAPFRAARSKEEHAKHRKSSPSIRIAAIMVTFCDGLRGKWEHVIRFVTHQHIQQHIYSECGWYFHSACQKFFVSFPLFFCIDFAIMCIDLYRLYGK